MFPLLSNENSSRQAGLTIIEFIVVILVLTIIVAYSASRWSSGTNPNAQAQQLAAEIRYTQSLAMTHNQTYFIIFFINNTYSITNSTGIVAANSVTGNTTATSLGPGMTFGSLSSNISANRLIAFDDFGVPYTDATATIALTTTATIPITSGNSTRTIQVNPATGLVTVQ